MKPRDMPKPERYPPVQVRGSILEVLNKLEPFRSADKSQLAELEEVSTANPLKRHSIPVFGCGLSLTCAFALGTLALEEGDTAACILSLLFIPVLLFFARWTLRRMLATGIKQTTLPPDVPNDRFLFLDQIVTDLSREGLLEDEIWVRLELNHHYDPRLDTADWIEMDGRNASMSSDCLQMEFSPNQSFRSELIMTFDGKWSTQDHYTIEYLPEEMKDLRLYGIAGSDNQATATLRFATEVGCELTDRQALREALLATVEPLAGSVDLDGDGLSVTIPLEAEYFDGFWGIFYFQGLSLSGPKCVHPEILALSHSSYWMRRVRETGFDENVRGAAIEVADLYANCLKLLGEHLHYTDY